MVDVEDGIDELEICFLVLGAEITKKKPNTISARFEHPDERTVHIKVKRYDGEVPRIEITHRSGDGFFFWLMYDMIEAYDFGRGPAPRFYPGQLDFRRATQKRVWMRKRSAS